MQINFMQDVYKIQGQAAARRRKKSVLTLTKEDIFILV